jgi:hypothetical protein
MAGSICAQIGRRMASWAGVSGGRRAAAAALHSSVVISNRYHAGLASHAGSAQEQDDAPPVQDLAGHRRISAR